MSMAGAFDKIRYVIDSAVLIDFVREVALIYLALEFRAWQ